MDFFEEERERKIFKKQIDGADRPVRNCTDTVYRFVCCKFLSEGNCGKN